MNILVIGASGCLGGILMEDFAGLGPVVGTYCSHPCGKLVHLDATDGAEVARVIKESSPDLVLYCGAFTHVDGCEEKPAESYRVNVEGTRNVIEAVRGSKAKYVFFSSDYVFDGRGGPYGEEDPPRPIQVYGHHKLEAERLVQMRLENFLIVRVHGVFGWERQGKNFVVRLIQALSQGKTMIVPSDQVGSPTYAPNLSEALRELVERNQHGVYHLVGTTVIDRCSFARLTAEVFGLDETLIVPKKTAELDQKAPRPLQSGLRVDKAARELKTRLWSAEESLRHMKATQRKRYRLNHE